LAVCLFSHCSVLPRRKAVRSHRISIRYIALTNVIIVLIIIAIIYSIIIARQYLNHRLDESSVGQDILISGRVSSLPVASENSRRFEFDVNSFRLLRQDKTGSTDITATLPRKLRLSWYYGEAVNAGETWQLEVRLKPPHGFMNPGGFDYESWLYQQGIDATGYVRQSEMNRRLQSAPVLSIDRIRQTLSQQIDIIAAQKQAGGSAIITPGMALVKALAIGDKSSLSIQQWRTLSNTGTSHLMAISGLHIGLAALFGYMLVRRLLPVCIMKRIPAQHVSLVAGLILALCYALIAGLSIPTQRAIIMLLTLSLMTLMRRNTRPVDSLGLAMFVVLLLDPAAVLSAGFWFSFSAVAVIYISVVNGYHADDSTQTHLILKRSTLSWLVNILKEWMKLQLMISLFLLPLSLFMFQQGSLISPLANLLLIPYVSFLVVPVILLAIACSFLSYGLSAILFKLAAALLDFIWPVLSSLSELPYAFWVKGDIDVIGLLLASTAMLLLYFSKAITRFLAIHFAPTKPDASLFPAYWSFRLLACLLFLPLLITARPPLSSGDFQLTILDVGQGSAAVIRTQNHVAIFDSGARFSDRMDAGSSVLVPYLRSQGIRKLDRLIISHGDSDHIGGAQTVLESFPEADLLGQDIDTLVFHSSGANIKSPCYAGIRWHWDGVDFEFLSPEKSGVSASSPGLNSAVKPAANPVSKQGKRNNHSCVLRIASASGSVLFTGDIEKAVENQLLQRYPEQLNSDILIVPHHGSNTSSSLSFIQQVKPELSLISVGYKNRYQLPSSQVTARYETIKSELIETDKSGAITISVLSAGGISVDRYRERVQKYWHHRLH
jgi:competence protein ComEC